ncbi:hypothetical protein AGLY_003820 [Aphis glycines]|uniref:Uncharacterized protein n=1 Tax=Aphis glycines TaxID=307491 RepID=A0A6G0TZA5_APHGL|nr:hypothetical protein AGLY_003820 [Aphis glycines]
MLQIDVLGNIFLSWEIFIEFFCWTKFVLIERWLGWCWEWLVTKWFVVEFIITVRWRGVSLWSLITTVSGVYNRSWVTGVRPKWLIICPEWLVRLIRLFKVIKWCSKRLWSCDLICTDGSSPENSNIQCEKCKLQVKSIGIVMYLHCTCITQFNWPSIIVEYSEIKIIPGYL